MKIAVFVALGLLLAVFLFIWLMTRIRYRIGSRCVKVILFGLPIRRVRLDNIDSVSKRRGDGLAESWWSTLKPKHRLLVIRKKRGLFRNFVITPKNRYIFKTDLERATQRVGNPIRSVTGSGAEGLAEGPEGDSIPPETGMEERVEARKES